MARNDESSRKRVAGDAKRGRPKAPHWRGNDPELKRQTREFCLLEFRTIFCAEWEPGSEGVIRRNELEREARGIFRALHGAFADLRDLADRTPGIGWHPPLLPVDGSFGVAARWLLDRALPLAREATMAAHAADAWDEQHPLHDEERVALIHRWDDYVLVEWHPPMAARDKQLANEREAAVVSILSGIWPNLVPHEEYTPRGVIHEEEKRIGPLLQRHQRPLLFADDLE